VVTKEKQSRSNSHQDWDSDRMVKVPKEVGKADEEENQANLEEER